MNIAFVNWFDRGSNVALSCRDARKLVDNALGSKSFEAYVHHCHGRSAFVLLNDDAFDFAMDKRMIFVGAVKTKFERSNRTFSNKWLDEQIQIEKRYRRETQCTQVVDGEVVNIPDRGDVVPDRGDVVSQCTQVVDGEVVNIPDHGDVIPDRGDVVRETQLTPVVDGEVVNIPDRGDVNSRVIGSHVGEFVVSNERNNISFESDSMVSNECHDVSFVTDSTVNDNDTLAPEVMTGDIAESVVIEVSNERVVAGVEFEDSHDDDGISPNDVSPDATDMTCIEIIESPENIATSNTTTVTDTSVVAETNGAPRTNGNVTGIVIPGPVEMVVRIMSLHYCHGISSHGIDAATIFFNSTISLYSFLCKLSPQTSH